MSPLRAGHTKLVDIRSRWDGTGVLAAATEDMSLADALRRCMHIGDEPGKSHEPGRDYPLVPPIFPALIFISRLQHGLGIRRYKVEGFMIRVLSFEF
jgi:hypothetical protein